MPWFPAEQARPPSGGESPSGGGRVSDLGNDGSDHRSGGSEANRGRVPDALLVRFGADKVLVRSFLFAGSAVPSPRPQQEPQAAMHMRLNVAPGDSLEVPLRQAEALLSLVLLLALRAGVKPYQVQPLAQEVATRAAHQALLQAEAQGLVDLKALRRKPRLLLPDGSVLPPGIEPPKG